MSIVDPYETSFTWTATPTQPWLTVTPASGEATDGLTVCAHLSGKAAGMYAGAVSVTVTGSVTSTLSLPVVMTVEAGGATCGGTAIAPQVLAATGTTTPKVSQSGVTIAFPVRNPNAAQRTYNWTATTNNAGVASPTTASGTLNVPGGATANASVVYAAGTHFSETATLGITVTDASAGSLTATGSASVQLQAPFLGLVTPATTTVTSAGTYYLTFNYTNNTALAQTVNILPGGYDNALESSWGLTTSGTGQAIGAGATNSITLGFTVRAGVTGTLTHTFAVGLTSDGSLNAGPLASGVINVNTVAPNQAPAASVSCTTVYAGQPSRCTMTGSDPDSDPLTASAGWTLLTTNTWYKDVTSGTPGTQQVCGTVTDSHAAASPQACGTATWNAAPVAPHVTYSSGNLNPMVGQTGQQLAFLVQNPNSVPRTYSWIATSSNTSAVTLTASSGTVRLAAGASGYAYVPYNPVGTMRSSVLKVVATDSAAAANRDSAMVTVCVDLCIAGLTVNMDPSLQPEGLGSGAANLINQVNGQADFYNVSGAGMMTSLAFGGRKAVQFRGSDSYGFPHWLMYNADYSLFFVVRGGSGPLFGEACYVNQLRVWYYPSSIKVENVYGGASQVMSMAPGATGDVWAITQSSTTRNTYQNNNLLGTSATGRLTGGCSEQFGRASWDYNWPYFSGYVGQVLLYNRVLNSGEMAQVQQYLRTKWQTQ